MTSEIENDLAFVMFVERRRSARIGSRQARDLIIKVKDALDEGRGLAGGPQELASEFPIH